MGADGYRDVYGGYGTYGDGEPDFRDYRTPPFIEEELLDPANQLWQPGNPFLRLHPAYLYPCLGERIVRAADVNTTPEARKQAPARAGVTQDINQDVLQADRASAWPTVQAHSD